MYTIPAMFILGRNLVREVGAFLLLSRRLFFNTLKINVLKIEGGGIFLIFNRPELVFLNSLSYIRKTESFEGMNCPMRGMSVER